MATKLTVDSQGNVVAVLNFNDDVPCEFDMTQFPRDTQKCSIRLLHEDSLVKFQLMNTAGRAGVLYPYKDSNHHKAWEVINTVLTVVGLMTHNIL